MTNQERIKLMKRLEVTRKEIEEYLDHYDYSEEEQDYLLRQSTIDLLTYEVLEKAREDVEILYDAVEAVLDTWLKDQSNVVG